MQVLPRFVSVDENGCEHEFLKEYFADEGQCLSMVFLKGYQWPFDSRKVVEGSSVIDLLVYRESVMRSRRVFLDFTKNPFGKDSLDYEALSGEAKEYLKNAGACFGTPIERLKHMNEPAIELYASKGVDLYHEMLEIALCAQHNNGGIAVDMWWQTCVEGLFVCGEAAGTHGIYRPGGSALNAGQVGSLRAAQYIAAKRQGEPLANAVFLRAAAPYVEEHRRFCQSLMTHEDTVQALAQKAKKRMSAAGGAIRKEEFLEKAYRETAEDLQLLRQNTGAAGERRFIRAYRLRDILICQRMYLFAMMDYIRQGNKTRGSSLYYDKSGMRGRD